LILDDARDTATKTVRKSRKRAIREAKARKSDADRMLNASEAKRKVEETAAQHANEEALSAQNLSASANAQMIRWVEQAKIGIETAARERDKLTATTAELKQTEKLRDLALKDTEEAQKAATKAMEDRKMRGWRKLKMLRPLKKRLRPHCVQPKGTRKRLTPKPMH